MYYSNMAFVICNNAACLIKPTYLPEVSSDDNTATSLDLRFDFRWDPNAFRALRTYMYNKPFNVMLKAVYTMPYQRRSTKICNMWLHKL